MKTVFKTLGLLIAILGSLPLINVAKQCFHANRLDQDERTYFGYNGMIAILIFLVSVAIGTALFLFGSRYKKNKSGPD